MRGNQRGSSGLTAAFVLTLLMTPAASANHEVTEGAAQLVDAADRSAGQLSSAAASSVARVLDSAATFGGALGDAAAAVTRALLGREAGSDDVLLYLALGEGTVAVNGAPHCAGMQAKVYYHTPYSNEPAMIVDFAPGQGSFSVCGIGWRFAYNRHELQGNPQEGFSGESHTIDADIWMTISPPGSDGTSTMWVRQVTIIGDELEFEGTIARVV